MLQYVNSFACSLNKSKDTLIIHFSQKEPVVSNDDGQMKIEVHNISSIVMDGICAKGLIETLTQLFDE